jgi:hydrogenase expression/formation protein HypE
VIIIVDASEANQVLDVMQATPFGREARIISEVVKGDNAVVHLEATLGGSRIINMLSGKLLPRIC